MSPLGHSINFTPARHFQVVILLDISKICRTCSSWPANMERLQPELAYCSFLLKLSVRKHQNIRLVFKETQLQKLKGIDVRRYRYRKVPLLFILHRPTT